MLTLKAAITVLVWLDTSEMSSTTAQVSELIILHIPYSGLFSKGF